MTVSSADAVLDPTLVPMATHMYTPLEVRSVREMIRLLVIEKAELVSVILKLSPLVRGILFPSLSIITQETMGRGNPSTEQLNTAP